VPFLPARPVRPERCCSVSASRGISTWTTRLSVGRSIPRAATSVATQTRARRSRRACSAWLRSLRMLARQRDDGKAALLQVACRWRTLSRVAQNSIAVSASWKRSRLTTAFSISGRDGDRLIGDVAVPALVAAVSRCAAHRAGKRGPAPRSGAAWWPRTAGCGGSGVASRISSSSSRKPMSSISSASSSTTAASAAGRARRVRGGRAGGPACRPRCARRAAARGVPAAGSCRPRRWRCARRAGVKPVSSRRPAAPVRASARSPAPAGRAGGARGHPRPADSAAMASPKATVLPEPVCAETTQIAAIAPRARARRPGPGSAISSLARSGDRWVGRAMTGGRPMRRATSCAPAKPRGKFDRGGIAEKGEVPRSAAIRRSAACLPPSRLSVPTTQCRWPSAWLPHTTIGP
jgi:hypothetical protein